MSHHSCHPFIYFFFPPFCFVFDVDDDERGFALCIKRTNERKKLMVKQDLLFFSIPFSTTAVIIIKTFVMCMKSTFFNYYESCPTFQLSFFFCPLLHENELIFLSPTFFRYYYIHNTRC